MESPYEIQSTRSRGRKANYFVRKYGLSSEDYLNLLRDQRGYCGLCAEPFVRKFKDMVVDHDHVTGKVRGILHSTCNIMLGMAKDRPDILRLGAEYLDRHQPSEYLYPPKLDS